MKSEIQNESNKYQVSFSPADKQVKDIENWLIDESVETGEGFYCNWKVIEASSRKNELATISIKDKAIGFATWQLTTDKTARIEIVKIKSGYRKKGIGKKLITQLISFLKGIGVYVVDLECSPANSEYFWKRIGFLELPLSLNSIYFTNGGNKKLYRVLIEGLQKDSVLYADETFELWDDEPFRTNENTPPTFVWNVSLVAGTRILTKSIIHPAHYDWRLRWRCSGKTIKDDKVKRFNPNIVFGPFVIIDALPF